MDDGSSDGTAAVAAGAEVRYLFQSNAGPAAARERGWRSSSGEVVVFLDDDVLPAPDAIAKLVLALEAADGVGADILPIDTGPIIAHYLHVEGVINHWTTDGTTQWLITAAAAFRRDALEEVGGFNLDFPRAGEDVDLSMRLLEHGHELRVETAAIVWHDHRTRFSDLVRTFHLYGSAYRLLAARHAAFRTDRKRSALLRANPIEWARVYRRYRQHGSVLRSLAFLILHALVVIPYGLGAISGSATAPARRESAEEVLLVGHPQDLVGAREPAAVTDLVAAEQGTSAA